MALTKITSTNIGANAVTSALIANVSSSTITTGLGYTPANKAGDTFTGNINVGYDGYPAIKFKNAAGTDKAEMYVGTSAGDLNIVVAAGAAIAIDSSGRMRTPYQPAFSARRTSSTGTSTVILYDDIILNVGSNYSSSTGRFTAPVAGNYLFYMTFTLDRTTSTADAYVDIRKNTSIILRVYTTGNGDASSHPSQSGQVVLPMSAGDYVDCYFVSGPTSIHPNANHNVFGGHLIG